MRTRGGWPRSTRRAATAHLSAFVTAAAPMVEPGTHGIRQPRHAHQGIAGRRAVVDDHVGDVGEAQPAGMFGRGRQAVIQRDHGDHGQGEPPGLQRHVDDDLVDAAVGVDEERVGRAEHEIPQDHLPQPLHMFEEHGLPLAVGAHDDVVVGQRQLHDGMEARKAAVAREHLLDEDTRVAGPEEVHQAAARRWSGRRCPPRGRCSPVGWRARVRGWPPLRPDSREPVGSCLPLVRWPAVAV